MEILRWKLEQFVKHSKNKIGTIERSITEMGHPYVKHLTIVWKINELCDYANLDDILTDPIDILSTYSIILTYVLCKRILSI